MTNQNASWAARVRSAFADLPHPPDEDVVDELAQHASAAYDDARAAGRSPAQAEQCVSDLLNRWRLEATSLRRRRARSAMASPPPFVRASFVSGALQDLRYAVRLACLQPRHALLTIAIAALGIAVTTVLFTVTYGVLFRPLPWPNGERLITLREMRGANSPRFGEFTNAAYVAWREHASTLDDIAAWSTSRMILSGAGDADRVPVTAATSSLFRVLGVQPLLGTFFGATEETSRVVVLSESLWRERFLGNERVIGRSVGLDGVPYTIVGVLADRFAFPDRHARAIIPYVVPPATGGGLALFSAVAAVRPGVTAGQAADEGTARGRFAVDTGMTTVAIFGGQGPVRVLAEPLRDATSRGVREPLLMLLAGVALLFLTAISNVAGLQLARATARSREMAIRSALGAGTSRVARQLLTESLVLGVAAGAAGLALAWLLQQFLPVLLPPDFPRTEEIAIDPVVVAFVLVLSFGTAIVLGVLPAWRVRQLRLASSLAEDGNAPLGAGVRSGTSTTRMLLMAGQIAIACVLLVGTSLLGRSLLALIDADRGFEPAGLLSARLSMPESMYGSPEERFAIVERVLQRLATLPGVTAPAFTSELPLLPGGSTASFVLPPREAGGGTVHVQASPRIVSARYFSALRMRVIAGRTFADSDTDSSPPVVVVNRTFARRYLPDSPLGARLPVVAYGPPDRQPREAIVVGVVDDVRYVGSPNVSQPEMYYAHRQMQGRLPVPTVTLLARTAEDPALTANALRWAVRDADARLVADAVMPLEGRLLATLARPRFYAVLLGGFAGFALMIAAVGLFGVLSYVVSLRSRELAIRAALGARQSDLLVVVLRQGLKVAVAGVVIGLLSAAWLTRLLSTQLYAISAHDTVTFTLAPLLLLVVALLACIGPAVRAAKLDAVATLRHG